MVVAAAGPTVTRNSPSGKRCSAISCSGSRAAPPAAAPRRPMTAGIADAPLTRRFRRARAVADDVAGVGLGAGERQIEFRLVEGIDAVERLALLDPIADLLEHLDAGALVDRRAGGAREPVEPQAVDRLDHAVARRRDVGGQRAEIGAAVGRPLRLDDLVHLLERGAAVEQFLGAGIAGAAAQLGVVFEQMRGKPQRLLAQIAGRGRLVGQHRHHVLRLQHRADAVADRLAAVGGDHLDRDAEMIADEFEQLAQPHRLHRGGHLGRRADRQVDQQMASSRPRASST